jgi:hypothetical protein
MTGGGEVATWDFQRHTHSGGSSAEVGESSSVRGWLTHLVTQGGV